MLATVSILSVCYLISLQMTPQGSHLIACNIKCTISNSETHFYTIYDVCSQKTTFATLPWQASLRLMAQGSPCQNAGCGDLIDLQMLVL